ncbi:MAG TPA: hypothetical protein VGP79_03930 [Bryobacteraceae bacterium]|jgi:hypothetical protein|nr:hypothetical protein [Bryobacteraceae bacterium]
MKTLVTPIFAIALAAAGVMLLWPTHRVRAFNPQPDPPAFGLIGVDNLETARLNAMCADGLLPGDVPPGPCDVTLSFRDISGRVLKQITASLQPGQGASLDIGGMEMSGRGRMEIQPRILPTGRGFILATVDLFDVTGRTAALLNPTEPKSLQMMPTPGQ